MCTHKKKYTHTEGISSCIDITVLDVDTFQNNEKGQVREYRDELSGEVRHETGKSNGGLEGARDGKGGVKKKRGKVGPARFSAVSG